MFVTLPIVLTLSLLIGSFFQGWAHPLKVQGVELRAGHGIASNNPEQPSGFQLTHLLPSVEVPLTETMGPSWARGRVIWNPELQLGIFSVPNVRPLFGINPLQVKYELTPWGRWSFYAIAGVGVVYSNIERPETDSDYNISLIEGAGFRYAATARTAWLLEYRHQHISNNETSTQNTAVDSHTFLVGLSLRS
jgi:hypothetical protein